MDIILSKSHPLLHYAFSHGFRHLQCLESGNGAVIDGMIALRLDIERHPIQWQRLTAQHDFITCVLVSLLPEPFLRAFLHRAPFKALDRTSPLIYATYFGKIEHARTLLSCGVGHVNSTGLDVERPRQVLPLEAAFHYRHRPLFDLFLLHSRVTMPPRLFSSVFYEQYLVYTPRDSTMLLRCDEFAEWVADGRHGQSLLHALDNDWRLVMQSASEEVVLILLRRLAQVGCDFSGPDSLESVLRVILCAASQRSLSVLLYLHSLDVLIPSRALLIGRMTLVEGLTLRGLDVHAIMTQGDIAMHRAFGECKHGSSCWAPDCNLCSVFLRVMGPQLHLPIDVLLVGRKGAGKSALVNMILGVPDHLPGAAQVSDGGTLQITSYATQLGSLPAQIWDTPGFDKTLEGHHIEDKFNDWLLQVSSSHSKHDVETDHLYLNLKLPIIQVVWCMHAEEISDPAAWQQFQAIYAECRHRSGVTFMVLINQVSVQSPGNWEVQCQDQLQVLGLSASSGLLKSVRRHLGVSSPEYEDDAQTLSQLIRQHALQNHRGILTLDLDHGVDTLIN
ncbi:hypothetical protein JVT61DRAFT_4524 [Boletus reticuloceps]|uniref:G domain-containing protein n=1 Tax=Boletus reticuloceps TaxID=495285 RepID=A0A8I3A945_9AGAM|nr:hypothetical protein JVT61DRAFT_4524 [Boletus reticuloceps]